MRKKKDREDRENMKEKCESKTGIVRKGEGICKTDNMKGKM